MIFAGFVLFAIGTADLVRQFASRRWIGYVVVAVILLLLGGAADALLPMVAALVAGVVWIWCMPAEGRAPAGFWPAVLLGILSVGAVASMGARSDAGLIGQVWDLRSPFGDVPFDLALLALGAGAFLLESANLVVRAALDGEHTWRPVEIARRTAAVTASPPAESSQKDDRGFQGGRLIGPLERVLVMMLTLAAAYPILAAMLAAKGIVRFPEISKDGETGARAEYFLVGSLVSWLTSLAAAFLAWWAAHS